MKNARIIQGVSFALAMTFVGFIPAFGAADPPNARAFLPSKTDLQNAGFSGWIPPWEFKSFPSGNFRYQSFPSEEAYFAAGALAKLTTGKKMMLQQFQAIPDAQIEELRTGIEERLSALDKENIPLFVPFPALNQQIELDILELVRQKKFSKQSWQDAYQKRLGPLDSASEISFAAIKSLAVGQTSDMTRAGRINIRVYLYAPDAVKARLSDYTYAKTDTVFFEKKMADFYVNTAKALLKFKGGELEDDLEDLLKTPSANRTPYQNDKIRELNDTLEALDVLQASNPTINSALLPYGDNCIILRAIYTFPEGKRAALSKGGGEVSTQINANLRVGSAVAQLELITNDNSLYTDASVNKLLEILAKKLQPFRLP